MLDQINSLLWEILREHITASEADWLQEKCKTTPLELMTAFVAAPRFLAKRVIKPHVAQTLELNEILPGFSVEDWGVVRLSRVWLLSCLDTTDKDAYCRHIDTLFDTAEMNEMVALYSSLPVLEYPEKWLFRASDAVRSNMGVVFDAIALRNPYPAKHFTQLAWNQLVLKAIFTDKPIHLIVGLEERVNENLAFTLSDFAHERWAAGRTVPPQVWRLVSKFLNEDLLSDIKQLFVSEFIPDQQAAALTCHHSDFEPAKQLLSLYPKLEKTVHNGKLSWTHLEIY
ncbi:EboA domain-containing protein [Runella sp.]|jgi:hypothetical protein|uniref:EboA domain-containing protein n=1 Tax=Runella sp. TaxID=1960881 RepID=UPI0026081977|nr:EboA domain-containing protein [Runella sp.]